ncbi:sodium/potassium/calcium exchanger 1 isoform X2 [Lutzomyia longipalpis]|uniref:sodium/potassium/calcium exchanger 1 isoform X2 n=1 Tax=Lutzomyia longipalpis TaxID=7200 RepID=UPI00248360F3|nr:sodium/potassium/calcium exchanger 1 isoform X2 [Lutzomyia longipalpis]
MGNLLSVLIGCVGAIELVTLLNQITARAELEYERLCLSEMGQGALEEPSSAEGARIIQKILTETGSAAGRMNEAQAVPQFHFNAFERVDSVGTVSSQEINEEATSEENEQEVSYPWGDINPEHHKGFRHQMEKSLSIGELNEEDEKLGSSVESNKDWRNNTETATKISETDKTADVTVSSAVVQTPGNFEAPPRSFACVEQPDSVLEDENEGKVEEWLNHGHMRESYGPSGTLTRSKRYLQMESMDVQDGDTSTPTTDSTEDDLEVNLQQNNQSEKISHESSMFLLEEKEDYLGPPQVVHKSLSLGEISQEYLEEEDIDEEREEESLVSGEEEIEDFDDIVKALKKNVPKEEVKFDDLLEESAHVSQKGDAPVENESEEEETDEEEEEEEQTFPAREYAAYNEFPLENMIPYSESLPKKSDRCEILEQIRKENRRRNRNAGPDKYFAPRPSVIDFPVKLQMANTALDENLKVFPLVNVNNEEFFPTTITPMREIELRESKNLPEITLQEPHEGAKEEIRVIHEDAEKSPLRENFSASPERSKSPTPAPAHPEKTSPAASARDDLTKFLNTERVSVSPARRSVERENLRIVDRDDPMMNLLRDSMFPY